MNMPVSVCVSRVRLNFSSSQVSWLQGVITVLTHIWCNKEKTAHEVSGQHLTETTALRCLKLPLGEAPLHSSWTVIHKSKDRHVVLWYVCMFSVLIEWSRQFQWQKKHIKVRKKSRLSMVIMCVGGCVLWHWGVAYMHIEYLLNYNGVIICWQHDKS